MNDTRKTHVTEAQKSVAGPDAAGARLTRRRFMEVMAGALCMSILPGCAPEARPITIGMHIWPGYELTPMAKRMGWLDEKWVKLAQTGSATESLQLLKQGRIDGAGLTLDEVLLARESGIPLSIILVCDISAGADQFLARPEIRTLADIRGRRIGVEDGALGALMLHQVLQAARLNPGDIVQVSLSPDKHVDAWENGRIDAAVTYEPAASQLMELGANKLFDTSHIPELIVDVLAVRSSLLDSAHADALRHLVASHLRALDFLKTHKDDVSYQLAPRFKLPADRVMDAFKGLVLPDLKNNIRLLATSNPPMLDSAKTVADTMLEAGILHKDADLHDLIRPEFLPKEAS